MARKLSLKVIRTGAIQIRNLKIEFRNDNDEKLTKWITGPEWLAIETNSASLLVATDNQQTRPTSHPQILVAKLECFDLL